MSSNFYNSTNTNDFTLTATTCGDVTSTINMNDDSSVWFPYYMESTWMPYHIEEYKPEFHIKKGYKVQLGRMWDDDVK